MDESLYSFLGNAPYRAFLPRKPHPNGLLAYGISGYTAVHEQPFLLDMEPNTVDCNSPPRVHAQNLILRTQLAHPNLSLHVVMDAAFGNFDDVSFYREKDIFVTYSMNEKQKATLWPLLLFDASVGEGRAALLPYKNRDGYFLACAYRTTNQSGVPVEIRTVTSAFGFTKMQDPEDKVEKILDVVVQPDKSFEYRTLWLGGGETLERCKSFIDDDGVMNHVWLDYVDREQIEAAFKSYEKSELMGLCDGQSLKVLSPFKPIFISYEIFRKLVIRNNYEQD